MCVYIKNLNFYRSNDIIKSIENLRYRGTEFLDIPDSYYKQLEKRLAKSKVKVKEDVKLLQKLKILIDYDDDGYLLQVNNNIWSLNQTPENEELLLQILAG